MTIELDEKLNEVLSYERPFYSRLAYCIRNSNVSDLSKRAFALIKHPLTIIAGFGLGMALILGDYHADKVKQSAADIKPAENCSLVQGIYTDDEISAVSNSTQVPAKIIKAIDIATNSPDYAAYCKAAGRIGPIPIDSLEQGVLPELLKNKELCLALAAEQYKRIRLTVKTDLDALVVLLSSKQVYEKAVRGTLCLNSDLPMNLKLVDEYLNGTQEDDVKLDDYTSALQKPVRDAVQKARVYLNKVENGN
jgi:hypothetical protein